MAGEHTLAGYAFEDALAHFQRGLAAKEGKPPDEEYADILFGIGRAQVAQLCDTEEEVERFESANEHGRMF